MKKILLIGDSIRMGYDKYVKLALEDVAEVFYPKENCRFTQYVLRHFHEWANETGDPAQIDLVHWNVGLWDVVQQFGEEETVTPIEFYEHYIRRICKRIRLICPNAKVVFATSTPIHQKNYEAQKNRFWRNNQTICQYNEVAARVAKAHGFAVNDLYGLMDGVADHFFSDRTHYYTPAATERLTNRVLEVIHDQLGIRGKQLDYAQFFGASSKDVGM